MPRSLPSLMFAIAIVLSCCTQFAQADDAAKRPTKILMLTESKGFVHGSVRRPETKLSVAEVAMTQLGQSTGLFDVDCTQNSAADFTKENLAKYDIVMFYTTGELPIAPEDRDYFVKEWLTQKGHGYIGFHSAADTYNSNDPQKNEEFRWYWEIAGGTFNGHPWGAGTTVTMNIHDPDHPVMQPFGKVFVHQDEIYQYKNWHPENVRVLMSLDMAKCNPSKPYHVPVAWVRSWGEGKIYFNNLGHREETWTNEAFLASVKNAVQWMRGDLSGTTEPNPEVSAQEEENAKKAAQN